jgi:hypothetical protein
VRHIRRPLLVVWDRLPAHRSALVREFLAYSDGYIETSKSWGFALVVYRYRCGRES